MPEYEDQDAILLLDELKKYFEAADFDPLDPSKLTISELAGDLIDSLPHGLVTPNYSVLKPNAASAGSHYREIQPSREHGRTYLGNHDA